MPYGPWDEYFIHQLPRTFDQVSDSEKSWSDRCYFNVHSPDGAMLLVCGYGNNPNSQSVAGYAKLSLADGRHWDLDVFRRCTTDRGDLHAGPMRLTCVEPLQRWKLELAPNPSGLEWELYYESRAPMWEPPADHDPQARTRARGLSTHQAAGALHRLGQVRR